jgi:EAL domain-containing protein (putative c-di-GMP-specific phosphodiesterase class I)/GGDEF domain-containing protein
MEAAFDFKLNQKQRLKLLSEFRERRYDLDEEKSVGRQFMDVLENNNISTVFQPIISLKDAGILGYEALSRGPANSMLESPSSLFDVAKVYGKLWELEFSCRIKALESISKKTEDINIFLNVDPHIMDDDKFKKGFTKEFLKQFNIKAENVIFEITEKNSVADARSFKKVIEHYKEQGYKIAIDDAGSGYSGLNLIADIHPHFIKLDMNLIRDIDKDGLKHALIKTFCDFCTITDIKVIAEGIETENEMNTLIDLGVNFGQGYFIQKPLPDLYDLNSELINKIKARNIKRSNLYFNNSSTLNIGDICRDNIKVDSNCTGAKLIDIFNSNPAVLGIPVVDKDKVGGLIMKDKFYAKLGTQYGFALYINRPISFLMNKRPLTVENETTIEIVSKQAMTRTAENLYDYIIVTKNGNYNGIVTIKDILEKTIELEVNYAKHLNPLSGLPGNILIEQRLREFILNVPAYTILYIDIDNFKVYNDAYGFENGDRVLQFLSSIINENVSHGCLYNNFVGHVGGDDFVVMVESHDVEEVAGLILAAFDKGINKFYSKEDFERKCIFSRNRHGKEEQYGLLTLSIAGVSNKKMFFNNIYELTEYASKVKKRCKEIWENCYCVE